MSKYNWTIDTLIGKMKLIEKLIENEADPEKLKVLQADFYNLQNHINEYFDQPTEERFKLLESYDYFKDNLTSMDFLWGDFKEFAETIDLVETPELKRCTLSRDDILIITHDFYKSLNSFFFGNFMKNFYRRQDHIIFRSKSPKMLYIGESITLPSLKESFIDVCRNFTIEDIFTTIHEYAHATSVSINHKHLYTTKTLFTEIDSLFMELIAADFLESLFKDGSTSIIKAETLNEQCSAADDITAMIDLIDAERFTSNGYTSNKLLKTIAEKHCKILPVEVEAILNGSSPSLSLYLTSYMFAISLYQIYKIDKEKALYYLKKIIQLECMEERQYYNNIRKLGIIPNQGLQEYQNQVQEEIQILSRKKSKPNN